MPTYSLTGGTLATNGQLIRVRVIATAAATVNSKTLRVYFGSTAVAARASAVSGANFYAEVLIWRTGAAAQIAQGTVWANSGNGTSINVNTIDITTPSATLSGAVTIKATVQGGASSDLTIKAFTVEILN